MVSPLLPHPLILLLLTRMPTRPDARILAARHQVIVCSWGTIVSHGHLAAIPLCLAPALRLSIVQLLLPLLRLVGSGACYRSSDDLLKLQPLFTVTMSVLFTYQRTPFNIAAQSISNWTYIFCGKRLLSEPCVFFMCPQALSLLIYLPRDYRLPCSMVFDPVFRSAKRQVHTAGAC